MVEAPDSVTISTKQRRIAELAKGMPGVALRTLAHHMDKEWLHEAHRRTRKGGATGVDGQTAQQYAEDLDAHLGDLLERAKSGVYRAPPVRRVDIPKSGRGNETRPLGIPTFEDKVLQRAAVMLLEPIYEQDFLDCSYGFRPRRSAHQALESVWQQLMDMGGGWVVDLDIRRFFDTLDHDHLRAILRQRVQDGILLRLIGKWLQAGVLAGGFVSYPTAGTPQDGVISPLLANVYLHEVLDRWFAEMVKPVLRGDAFMVRYADDVLLVFKREDDARRVLSALPRRLGRFGLTLHPEKTRLLDFRRPRGRVGPRGPLRGGSPRSFDLLGFTHFWARSRKGHWVVRRRTATDRFSRSVHALNDWCRRHRHFPIEDQHRLLCRRIRGLFQYWGITGNSRALCVFRAKATELWWKWLSRRSQRSMSWSRFAALRRRYPLPRPIAVHSTCRPAASP